MKHQKRNFQKLLIINFVLAFGLLALYIFQVNSVISQVSQIKHYQEKIGILTKEVKNLKIKWALLNNLETLSKEIENLGFVENNDVRYIQVLENQVVTR